MKRSVSILVIFLASFAQAGIDIKLVDNLTMKNIRTCTKMDSLVSKKVFKRASSVIDDERSRRQLRLDDECIFRKYIIT